MRYALKYPKRMKKEHHQPSTLIHPDRVVLFLLLSKQFDAIECSIGCYTLILEISRMHLMPID